MSSITGGTDAQGEVTVRLEEDGPVVTGQGVDPDVVTASARAFINGLNRLHFLKETGPKGQAGRVVKANSDQWTRIVPRPPTRCPIQASGCEGLGLTC